MKKKRIWLGVFALIIFVSLVLFYSQKGKGVWTLENFHEFDSIQLSWDYTREDNGPGKFINTNKATQQFGGGVQAHYEYFLQGTSNLPIVQTNNLISDESEKFLPLTWTTVSMYVFGQEEEMNPYTFRIYAITDSDSQMKFKEHLIDFYDTPFLCIKDNYVLQVENSFLHFILNAFRDYTLTHYGIEFQQRDIFQP